jgi:hypothetical protein
MVRCRECHLGTELRPEAVEDTGVYCYHQCPNCNGSFPIRREDYEAMKAAAEKAAATEGAGD